MSIFNTKHIRRVGFISDQKGIIKRYINEEKNWDSHLKNTKDFIIQSAKNKKKGKAFIFGSGWLLDVPIDYLSDAFEKVYLVDIVHPSQVKHKLRKKKNIVYLEADITGGTVDDIFKLIKNKKPISDLKMQAFQYPEDPDFVVSVNILNQLDIILVDFLLKKRTFSEEEIKMFRKRVQSNHISSLPVGLSCLITDNEELKTNDKNTIIHQKKLIHINLPESDFEKQWQWNFDMNKTYDSKYNTVFNVIAKSI